MTNGERIFIRWLTAFLYGCAIFLFVGIGMWFYPRQVIKSATPMSTDKPEYSQGERVFVSGETWTNADTQANYDVRLVCNGVKLPYTSIPYLQTSRQAAPVKYSFPYPPIPEYVPKGSTCRIETTGSYTVQILPFITREYQYTFTSNYFQVKE